MTTSEEIPSDPLDWSDEHMLHLILHRLAVDEGILPLGAYLGVWYSGSLNESTRAIYDLDDHCVDDAGIAIPGVVVSMTDDALRWFRTSAGAMTIQRIISLMEKPIYVEAWDRKIA